MFQQLSPANCIDQAFQQALQLVFERGRVIQITEPDSISSGKEMREVLNASLVVSDSYRRVTTIPTARFALSMAAARTFWMLSSNDRVEDIAFYSPSARHFSDDGLIIPGSSYGRRIFNPSPGINQVRGVIERLGAHQSTRRAFIVVAVPEDAERISHDIPCTLSLTFHIRDGELLSHTIMRANNALSLLMYNFFEFSMLAELIAAELGVELGAMTHSAISLHFDEHELNRVENILKHEIVANDDQCLPHKFRPGDLAKIPIAAKIEAQIRRECIAADEKWMQKMGSQIEALGSPQLGWLLNVLLKSAVELSKKS